MMMKKSKIIRKARINKRKFKEMLEEIINRSSIDKFKIKLNRSNKIKIKTMIR